METSVKERANEAYREKKYEEAVSLYTEALNDKDDHDIYKTYANRSASYANLEKY